jgi:hypothetical protein
MGANKMWLPLWPILVSFHKQNDIIASYDSTNPVRYASFRILLLAQSNTSTVYQRSPRWSERVDTLNKDGK